MKQTFVKFGIRFNDEVVRLYQNNFRSNRRIVFIVDNRNVEIKLFDEITIIRNHTRLLNLHKKNPLVSFARNGMIIIGEEEIFGGLLLYCYGDVDWANMKCGQIAYMEHDPDRYIQITSQDLLVNEKCG